MPNTFNMFTPVKKIKRKPNLVEFRAGKLRLGKDKMVYADQRKGLAYITRSKDGMIHFCWKERSSDQVEDDLIVFPQETVFRRLPECTTGRVYLLQFKDSKRLFLWMQEPREEKDYEICKSVNNILNQRTTTSTVNQQRDINMTEFTNLLGQLNDIGALNEIDLMEILGMTHDLESHGTTESGVSNFYGKNTNPFQVGSNYSIPTFAERDGVTGTSKDNLKSLKDAVLNQQQSTRIDGSSLNSQSNMQHVVILDPNSVFSTNTLINLSKNKVFRSKVLFIDAEDNKEMDITSEAFKSVIKNFGIMMADNSMAQTLLQEMGVPKNIISKFNANDTTDLINGLETYFGTNKNEKQ